MAKKTLEEKGVSDTRNLYTFESLPSSNPRVHNQTKTYVLQDKELQKTIILTLIMLAFQAVLFFSLKNNLVSIPGISY